MKKPAVNGALSLCEEFWIDGLIMDIEIVHVPIISKAVSLYPVT